MTSEAILIVGVVIFGIFLIGTYIFFRVEFGKDYYKDENIGHEM